MLLLLLLLLLFAQEVDNELLVVLDEVIGQALALEILAKVLAPQGVELVEEGKLGDGAAAAGDGGGHVAIVAW